MSVIEVDDETTEKHLEKIKQEAGDKLVVVDFGAGWCQSCGTVKPVFTALADQMKDSVVFVYCDVDENDDTAMELQIAALPAFHFYRSGKLVKDHQPWDELIGAANQGGKALEDLLRKEIQTYSK